MTKKFPSGSDWRATGIIWPFFTCWAWGFSGSTQANAIVTLVNELRDALVAIGAIKGS